VEAAVRVPPDHLEIRAWRDRRARCSGRSAPLDRPAQPVHRARQEIRGSPVARAPWVQAGDQAALDLRDLPERQGTKALLELPGCLASQGPQASKGMRERQVILAPRELPAGRVHMVQLGSRVWLGLLVCLAWAAIKASRVRQGSPGAPAPKVTSGVPASPVTLARQVLPAHRGGQGPKAPWAHKVFPVKVGFLGMPGHLAQKGLWVRQVLLEPPPPQGHPDRPRLSRSRRRTATAGPRQQRPHSQQRFQEMFRGRCGRRWCQLGTCSR